MEKQKKRQLTNAGYDILRAFLFDRGVDREDIRIEIYDHYATKIEEIINADRSIDYDDALMKTHKALGGDKTLKKLVKSKKKELRRYWNKRMNAFMLSYLTLPKILLTLFIVLSLFTVAINIESNKYAMIIFLVIEFIVFIASTYLYYKSIQLDNYYKTIQLYTFEYFNSITNPIFLVLFVINGQQFIMNTWKDQPWVYPIFLVIGISGTTYFVIKAHAFHTQFRFWIKEELEKKYPEHLELIKF